MHEAGTTTEKLRIELALEQQHVDAVYRRLAELAESAKNVASDGRSLYRSDRTSYVREEDSTGLFERDAFTFQAAKRLAVLDSEHEGLVFGRLDRHDGEVRYIGRLGVRDAESEPLVIDWRAPAAEPFYRATPADPMAVLRRRVLRCRGERVIGIEDDLLDAEGAGDLVVIGEGALLAALSRSRGPQMRDIVATIQAAQDEAIRAPYPGFTVISGGPGTGKTVVALHRAAFLLYTHRRRFTTGGVLVVGPSAVFMNYIERVLPSLGEDAVTLRAIGAVPAEVVGLSVERIDDAPAARVKGGLAMLDVLRELIRDPDVLGAAGDLRVMVKGEPLTLRAPELQRIRSEVLRQHSVNRARGIALDAVISALWRQWNQRTADEDENTEPESTVEPESSAQHESTGRESAVELSEATAAQAEDESLRRSAQLDRPAFAEIVGQTAAWRMFAQVWWRRLDAPTVLLRLSDPVLVARIATSLSAADQQALVSSYQALAEARPDWSVADAALLDELTALLGVAEPDPDDEDTESIFLPEDSSVRELTSIADTLRTQRVVDPGDEPFPTYAHILVDEAQDLTPMQWRMLRRRGAQASWTIVGDLAQTSWHDAAEARRALEDVIGAAPQRRFRMNTNYRSPAEVFDLARQVITTTLPEADLPEAVRSTGHPPELRVISEHGSDDAAVGDALKRAVAELATQVAGSIAVITAPADTSRVQSLLEQETLAAAGLNPELRDRLSVLSARQSKGLEWDAVIVLDPDAIVAQSSGGARQLYVAMTRPTQRLIMLDLTAGAVWRQSLEPR